MREWDPSLRIYLDVAKAAISNAERLAAAADTLLASGFAGPATTLAVVGQEEAGKALLYAIIGFALVPDDAIPVAVARASHHESKQLLAAVGRPLAEIAPKLRGYLDQVPDDQDASEDLLQPLLSRFVPMVLDEVRAFFGERPDFEERIHGIAERHGQQSLKHRGIYVDVQGGELVDPVAVTAEQASDALADLKLSLEGIRMFTHLADFSDEGVKFTRRLLEPHLKLVQESDSENRDPRDG